MARPKTSLLRRILVQTDRAFWCIHDHLDVLGYLALPTFAAVLTMSFGFIQVRRSWELPSIYNFLIVGLVIPFLAFCFFTVLPLPCAVFAWKAAEGERATAGECFAWCWRRAGRLASVLFRLGLLYFGSLLLFGIPLLWVWPRTCLTPLVALFESERRIFRRGQRILREDFSVAIMGLLYLCMGVVLGGLLVLPRLILGTSILGAQLLEAEWQRMLMDHLWIFETISIAILLTAIVMTWWISLTLVYHDIRRIREGEDLKHRIATYRARLVA
ncbi:hypothetical protein [Paludisphaera borealis]|uniref:Uncharacterized protein n=1 Tax=Paludisphaera borealis TaxID=1387353 RepID=A0A1U7CKL9_9BACT|nr:hypothetical protein [Paludisphaera borealis]APW59485.1 hypothetical protein BSF38_00909 [Paludisphaera borealis]